MASAILHRLPRAWPGLVMAGALVLSAGVASAQSFTGLGYFPPDGSVPAGIESYARSVSDNGVVTGFGFIPPENAPTTGFRAFGWTEAGGMVNLGTLPGGEWSGGRGISADGSVIAGWSGPHLSDHAFRYAGGIMTDLPPLPGKAASRAHGISDDGAVIVGFSGSNTTGRAFRWTQAGGMTDLGTPSGKGWVYMTAQGADADGSVVVGYAEKNAANSALAFRWTGGTMTTLGKLTRGAYSEAWATNATGTVVVGDSDSRNGCRAFRWAGGAMSDLGALPGYPYSYGRDVSGDGTIVVGYSSDGTTVTFPISGSVKSTGHAFLWTSATGMVDLNSFLAASPYNFDLTGWELREALGVSPNGEYITGWGMHDGSPEAWIVRLVP